MNNGKPSQTHPPGPSFRGQDILYALYRHKWMILLLSVLGLASGAAVFFLSKPTYASDAQLLVKYIVENRSLAADDATSSVRTPREDNVVNSEIGILSSFDLAKEVAQIVGPTNIVPNPGPDMDPTMAATIAIRKGLEVGAMPKSTIIGLRFQHTDPVIARAVLTNLVAAYFRAHARVHRSPDYLVDLRREADKRRVSLEQIGDDLRQIKTELGVSSVEEARLAYQEEIARTRREISVAETLLAEKNAALTAITGVQPKAPVATNADPATASSPATNTIPLDRLAEYRNLRLRIEELTKREQILLLEYTDLSPFVQAVRQRLATNQADLARLETEYPSLAMPAVPLSRPGETPVLGPQMPSPAVEIPAIEARLKSLNGQLEKLRADALRLDERGAELERMTRQRAMEEKQYVHLATALDQAGVDQTLVEGRAANISVIQQPTPAAPAQSVILKLAGGLAGGGIVLSLALSFGLEMMVDQSLRRRGQVETNLRVPVFLSIPRLRLRKPAPARKALRPARTAVSATPALAAPDAPGPAEGEEGNGNGKPRSQVLPPPPEVDVEMATYVEALRDRLIMHFETEGLERKPKLVGLTSCGHGAGVTTLATSLAASLSETGDGNVLYVDMNPHRGPSVLPFQRGESKVALAQAFEGETRAAAQVQDNLYVVSLAEPGTRRVGVVPKALAALMPKMKASDYDYIIFDFPPVTQTSVTAKVTGLLDMTFLVLESERTQTDLAKNALTLMGEGRAKVSAVLNKHKRYIPQRFDPDL
jgi:succinoglycan biosynthesis transport protein ExoP